MKNCIKIFLILVLFGLSYSVFADGTFDTGSLPDVEIASMTIDSGDSLQYGIENLAYSILYILKNILSAVIVLFLVYAGANMVFSLGSDDEKLSTSKNQIWYSAIGLLFINIPGTLYDVFYLPGGEVNENGLDNDSFTGESITGSFLVNESEFRRIFYDNIVPFMQVAIFGLAIMVIIFAGYKILMARGKDEDISDARSKILYSIVALFFVGFIETLKKVVYSGDLTEGAGLFSSVTNLILLFAAPVAIFFLFLATFYYITADGDDDKVKKAKNIVINTFLATILLMAIYTFLLDLITI